MTPTNDECLTYQIPQAAAILGISRNTCYLLANQGKLPGLIRLGQKRMVVSKAILERVLNGEVGNEA